MKFCEGRMRNAKRKPAKPSFKLKPRKRSYKLKPGREVKAKAEAEAEALAKAEKEKKQKEEAERRLNVAHKSHQVALRFSQMLEMYYRPTVN